jgi:hypothetical protein
VVLFEKAIDIFKGDGPAVDLDRIVAHTSSSEAATKALPRDTSDFGSGKIAQNQCHATDSDAVKLIQIRDARNGGWSAAAGGRGGTPEVAGTDIIPAHFWDESRLPTS